MVRRAGPARYDRRASRDRGLWRAMRRLGLMLVLTPRLLAGCGDDADAPAAAAPAPSHPAPPPAPAATATVPLRQTPGGLLGFPAAPPRAPAASAGGPGVSAAP